MGVYTIYLILPHNEQITPLLHFSMLLHTIKTSETKVNTFPECRDGTTKSYSEAFFTKHHTRSYIYY